jgi:hypothetical protein
MIDCSAPPVVMPAHAGIHALLFLQQSQIVDAACAGMTWTQRRWVSHFATWYSGNRREIGR